MELLSRTSCNFDFGAASTLKELAINSAAVRSGLSSASMTAVIVPGETVKVVVTYEGKEQWCSGCIKLNEKVELIEESLAEEKRQRELMEARLAEEESKRELIVIMGDLVGALYQVLFDTVAKALPEARRMPREVLYEGYMERINISFFLKHSNKEGGVLRKYLLRALEFKGITLSDYKILVAAKKIRNETFHNSVPNGQLFDTLRLSNIRDASFNDAREVLLRHHELLMEEEEER